MKDMQYNYLSSEKTTLRHEEYKWLSLSTVTLLMAICLGCLAEYNLAEERWLKGLLCVVLTCFALVMTVRWLICLALVVRDMWDMDTEDCDEDVGSI